MFFVRIPTHNPSPNPLAAIGPKLKPTPRHLLFTTTTVGAHRGAGSGACWAKFGRDLLRRLRRAPRMASRGFRLPGRFIRLFVIGAVFANESRGLRSACRTTSWPGGSTSTSPPRCSSKSTSTFCIDSGTRHRNCPRVQDHPRHKAALGRHPYAWTGITDH